MKHKIRKHVFETNSSSVHSIVISSAGLEPSNLPKDEAGYVHVICREFSKEYEVIDDQLGKLTYLVSWIANKYRWYYDRSEITEDYKFRYVLEAVQSYDTDCKGIIVECLENAEIDHQSVDEEIVNFYSSNSINNFIFNKYAELVISCD